MPVSLNEIPLFRVPGTGDLSAAERAKILEHRLQTVLESATGPPPVVVRQRGTTPLLESDGVLLLTVTESDASAAGATVFATAIDYREHLESGLARAWIESTGRYFRTALFLSVLGLVLGLGLHVAIGYASRRWLKTPGWLPRTLMWLILANVCALAFPHTRGLGHTIFTHLLKPLLGMTLLLIIGFVAWVAGTALINRYFESFDALRGDDERALRRSQTWRQVAHVVLDTITVAVTIAGFLAVLNINPTTLLAGAGIIGVALGVAAQDLLRDLTAGFAILIEDQFGVGDFIRVVTRDVSGTVVSVNLRATQIRNMEGSLITIPNSEIRVVENQSNEWSQADVRVLVQPGSDNISRGLAIMQRAAEELRDEEPGEVVGEPEMLGVENVGLAAVTLRMLVKTPPARQFAVRRKLLRDIGRRFEAEGVTIPSTSVAVATA